MTKPLPVANGIEHYIYLLIKCFSSLEKCVFRSSAHFKVRLFGVFFFFILLTELHKLFIYIPEIYLLIGYKINRYLLQCSRWTFHLLMVFFVVQMLCSFMQFCEFILAFVVIALFRKFLFIFDWTGASLLQAGFL